MSLLKDGRYELRAPHNVVVDFRKALIDEFGLHGFEHGLHVQTPNAPEIDQFTKDQRLVTLSSESDHPNQLLVIETESTDGGFFEELDDVIVSGAAHVLVEMATRLFHHFEKEQTREAFGRLRDVFDARVKRAVETE